MSDSNVKLLSELGKFELININDGEKYDCLQNNDLVIDDKGEIKFLIISLGSSKFGFLGGSHEFLEIPWQCVKKIGARTIILDAEESDIKKASI
ncbi:MAG: YlmC/YmxH family sporulation protein [Clostridiaceae bacterium]|nr:YlmC/YmxH family sporulation protein [Clostridiaceae bacterium]